MEKIQAVKIAKSLLLKLGSLEEDVRYVASIVTSDEKDPSILIGYLKELKEVVELLIKTLDNGDNKID